MTDFISFRIMFHCAKIWRTHIVPLPHQIKKRKNYG